MSLDPIFLLPTNYNELSFYSCHPLTRIQTRGICSGIETTFSDMKSIKSNYKDLLTNASVLNLLRLATTDIEIDINI